MKLSQITLWVNLVAQVIAGLLMLLVPGYIAKLVFVPLPNVFIQTIGVVALSIGLLCLLTLQKTSKMASLTELVFVVLATLAFFNFGLAIFLGVAALQGYVSWLGVLLHAPLCILCIYTLLMFNRKDSI